MSKSLALLTVIASLVLGCSDREGPGTGDGDSGPGDLDGDVSPDGSDPGEDAGGSGDDGGSDEDGGGSDEDGGGTGDDGGTDEDGGGAVDAGPDDGGGAPDRCVPPPCPPPPPGCHYEGTDPCVCGTLVCEPIDAGSPSDGCVTPRCPPIPPGCDIIDLGPCVCPEIVCDPGAGCEEAGVSCGRTEYCDYPDGSMCGRADGRPGVCRTRPDACLAIFDPVCGCDGMTYSNACVAHSRGTDDATSGECATDPPPRPDCRTTGCAPGETCADCGDPGRPAWTCLPEGIFCL